MELQLNAEQILTYLHDVANQLAQNGRQHVLVMVGGSLLAVHGLRDSTMDIDSVRQIEPELQNAIAVVADRHGLSPHWINSNASAFAPDTLDIDQCSILGDHPRLLVLGAPLDQVFIMKLHAARDRDREDLVRMWAAGVFDSLRPLSMPIGLAIRAQPPTNISSHTLRDSLALRARSQNRHPPKTKTENEPDYFSNAHPSTHATRIGSMAG